MHKKGALAIVVLLGCFKPEITGAPIQEIYVSGESGLTEVQHIKASPSQWNIEISDYVSNVNQRFSGDDIPKDSEVPLFKTDRWLCYAQLEQPTDFQDIVTVTCIEQGSNLDMKGGAEISRYAYVHTRGVGCLPGEKDSMDKEFEDLVIHIDCDLKK